MARHIVAPCPLDLCLLSHEALSYSTMPFYSRVFLFLFGVMLDFDRKPTVLELRNADFNWIADKLERPRYSTAHNLSLYFSRLLFT